MDFFYKNIFFFINNVFSSGAKSERWLKTKLRSVILAKEKQQFLRSKSNTPISEASSEHSDAESNLKIPHNKTETVIESVLQENIVTSEFDIQNSDAINDAIATKGINDENSENEIENNAVINNVDLKNCHEENICDIEDEKNNIDIAHKNDDSLQINLNLELQASEDCNIQVVQEKLEDVVSPVTESAEDALNYVSSSEDLSEEFNDCISSVSSINLFSFNFLQYF